MNILYDKDYVIRIISSTRVESPEFSSVSVKNDRNWNSLIYQKLPKDILEKIGIKSKKPHSQLKVAIICNWNDQCGISTYTKYLVDAITPKVKEIMIFSETTDSSPEEPNVIRCWKRGENLDRMIQLVKEWSPDFILIQHEYGIFPNAFRFMQLAQAFDHIPYAVVMHSVYKHLDKAVYSECAKNIIVHSIEGEIMLRQVGNTNNIYVVPHGCVQFEDTQELWNICQSPYTVIQFGFGFAYKGVDRAIRAIAHLKHTDKKFDSIQYTYLCSTNNHNLAANSEYCKSLMKLAEELNISNNIVIIQKYQTDEMINLYLRLAKIAIFPYVIDPNNEVYGASGAIRIALANKRPVIASESHLFDDLEGITPRPSNHVDLAKEIDKVFSDWKYREKIVNDGYKFVTDNSWDIAAEKYLSVYDQISDSQ